MSRLGITTRTDNSCIGKISKGSAIIWQTYCVQRHQTELTLRISEADGSGTSCDTHILSHTAARGKKEEKHRIADNFFLTMRSWTGQRHDVSVKNATKFFSGPAYRLLTVEKQMFSPLQRRLGKVDPTWRPNYAQQLSCVLVLRGKEASSKSRGVMATEAVLFWPAASTQGHECLQRPTHDCIAPPYARVGNFFTRVERNALVNIVFLP